MIYYVKNLVTNYLNEREYNSISKMLNELDEKPVFWNVNNSKTRPTHVRTTRMFIVLSKGKENAYFKKNGSQRYCPFVMEKSQGFVKHKSA